MFDSKFVESHFTHKIFYLRGLVKWLLWNRSPEKVGSVVKEHTRKCYQPNVIFEYVALSSLETFFKSLIQEKYRTKDWRMEHLLDVWYIELLKLFLERYLNSSELLNDTLEC